MMMMKSKANSDDEHNEHNGIVVCAWSLQVVYELNLGMWWYIAHCMFVQGELPMHYI